MGFEPDQGGVAMYVFGDTACLRSSSQIGSSERMLARPARGSTPAGQRRLLACVVDSRAGDQILEKRGGRSSDEAVTSVGDYWQTAVASLPGFHASMSVRVVLTGCTPAYPAHRVLGVIGCVLRDRCTDLRERAGNVPPESMTSTAKCDVALGRSAAETAL